MKNFPSALKPGTFGGLDRFLLTPAFQDDPVRAFQSTLLYRHSFADTKRALRELTLMCHGASFMAGWWSDKGTGDILDQPWQVPVKIALIHSEVSEAMEADRKSAADDKLPHRAGIEVELADAVIRIFDLAGALNLDLGSALVEKMQFNASRQDHKPESRAAAGGKSY